MIQRFNGFAEDSSQPSLLSSLLGTSGLTSSLPSKQDTVVYYMEAIVAFWIVGGIAIYLANSFSKR